MPTDKSPFKTMFMDAVNARMRAAADTFQNAWQICQITHRGTYQAFLNECELTKAANSAARILPKDGVKTGTGGPSMAEQFTAKVKEHQEATGADFETAWNAVKRLNPELWKAWQTLGHPSPGDSK